MHWYLEVVKKYVAFSGRARRMEFWMFSLVNFIIVLALSFTEGFTGIGGGLLSSLYSLAMILPTLGVTVRRLHDTGRSGLWILIGLIPVLGFIVLLVFMCQGSKPGPNQWGPNPKESGAGMVGSAA